MNEDLSTVLDTGKLRAPMYKNPPPNPSKRLGANRNASRSSRSSEPRQKFVSTVWGVDISHMSDSELVARIDRFRQVGLDDHGALAETFAIIAETIRRRLGAWRLFDPGFDHPALTRLSQMAPGLAGPDKTVIEMKAFVAEESKTRYFAEISLPADFYRAIDQSSVADALRFEPTDEQIVAGWLILDKTVVEMDAGEGKTVAAAFPAIVQALRGREIHVVTANDYLALRDAELLAPVYEVLGLTVGALLSHMGDAERRSVYRNDIVYGTLREFGFDYLRDNLRYSRNDFVQGPRQVAIVDEADHALIDEARTPLIISGRRSGTPRLIFRVKRAVEELIEEQRKLVSSLVKELAVPIDKEKKERFAKLFLADPRHDVVVSAIAEDKKLLSGIRMLVDEYAEDGIDNRLTVGLLYTVDVRRDMVTLTDAGSKFIEERLGPVFDTVDLEAGLGAGDANWALPLIERRREQDKKSQKISRQYGLVNQVHQMLRAYLLLERDEDYIVSDGKVVLIDDLTGRRKSDSKYQHGLQGALEAKEDVRVQPESETLAYLTVEGFVRQYDHVSGMTGTAVDATDQFKRSYSLNVARVQPTNELRRVDYSPRIYATQCEKLDAIMDEMRYWHGIGRPVLVGTRTVEQSDELSRLLTQADIPHNHLNAVTNDDEARIVQEAGAFGAVTVATNMAGRGTDILLDDDLDERVTERFLQSVDDLCQTKDHAIQIDCGSEDLVANLAFRLAQRDIPFRIAGTGIIVSRAGDEVRLEFGLGLHVIGTEMNESARVDRQLRGRSGRQGQYGSSRFLLSLEDRPFSTKTHSLSNSDSAGMQEFVNKVQSSIEEDGEAARTLSSDFAKVIERQTLNYYRTRNDILEEAHIDEMCETLVNDCVRRLVDLMMPSSEIGSYQLRYDDLVEIVRLDFKLDVEDFRGLGAGSLIAKISEAVITRFGDVAAAVSPAQYTRLVKTMLLQVGDEFWSQHLDILQDMMISAQLSSAGYTNAVTEFVFRADKAYGGFQQQVTDEFVSRLVKFETAEMLDDDESIILAHDLEAILL
jgi:preprotein translocase subunit SecA